MPDLSNAAIADAASTSSPTSTSSTARSSTACSPTATPPRPCARRRLGRRADPRGPGHRRCPGIGKTLEEKIQALLDTGTIPALEKLRANPARPRRHDAPAGPRPQARRASSSTSSASTRSRRCARPPRPRQLRDVEGFGAEVRGERARRVRGRRRRASRAPRVLLAKALEIGEQVVEALRAHPAAERVELAGSRAPPGRLGQGPRHHRHRDRPGRRSPRRSPSSTSSSRPASPGENAARGRTHTGLGGRPARRRARPVRQPAAALHRLGAHNMALREAAVRRGLHVSEYGILDDATGETTRCATEEEVYERLGLPWIPPELREDRGELAPRTASCPRLVEVERPARRPALPHDALATGATRSRRWRARALARGYEYIAHHRPLGDARLRQPRHARRAARARSSASARSTSALDGITVLDRHRDEHPPRRLARLRRRAARRSSTGSSARSTPRSAWPRRTMTDADGRRDRAPVDRRDRPPDRPQDRSARSPTRSTSTRVIEAAARTGTMLEINSRARPPRPQRRPRARARPRRACTILIDSDAHGAERARARAAGAIATARRAWLDRRADRQHAAVGGVRGAAQARRAAGRGARSRRPSGSRGPEVSRATGGQGRRSQPRSAPAAHASSRGSSSSRHDRVDRRAAERRERRERALGVAGRRVVERGAQRAPRGRRRPAAGRASRASGSAAYGPGAGGRHEQAAVGQRLELGDAVVLAARRGHEDARAAQQGAVGRRAASAPGDAHARPRGARVGAGDDELLARRAAPPPRRRARGRGPSSPGWPRR